MRSRCAWVASTALISLRDRRSASSAALARVMSEVTVNLCSEVLDGRRAGEERSVLVQDPRDGEALLLGGGRGGEHLVRREAGAYDVGTRHVGQRQRV